MLFAVGFEIPDGLGWLEYAPFAASLLLFGLPHGAADHLVPGRIAGRGIAGRGSSARSMLAVVALYLGLGGVYLALWTVAPLVCFALFVALTWFHWGQGDLHASREFLGARDLPAGMGLFVRGGLPMLVPLLAFPAEYAGVGASLAGLFGERTPQFFSILSQPGVRIALGLAFAVLAATYLARSLRRSGIGPCATEACEMSALAAYFALVPPVLAVGLYFCLWHSTRHIFRLALLDPPSETALGRGDIATALARFARDAAPLTFVALVILAALYLYLPASGAAELLAGYLVLISALTLPHVVLVIWMDLRQGIWRS